MAYTLQQQHDRLDAVKELNPNAIYNCADGVFTWIDDTTPISDADIDVKIEEMKITATNEETAKATAQASGNTKLLGLGLTQAEATALTGYTPNL
jgi:hypothetical protein